MLKSWIRMGARTSNRWLALISWMKRMLKEIQLSEVTALLWIEILNSK